MQSKISPTQSLKMFIGGDWVQSTSGETITSIDPASRELLAEFPRGREADVDRAVSSARRAFESAEWSEMVPAERGRILHSMAQKIRERSDELARLETLDSGKPLSQSRVDVEVSARYCEYYAGVADKILGETIPVRPDILDYTLREPLGVTAHIVPWNYPMQIALRGIAPALAAGNTVVLKPDEDTSITAIKVAEIAKETGLPDGVLNVVTGYGMEAGASLASHPDIDHLTFTGSVPTGIGVMKAAAANVKPVTLELGGKSPNIVFADANMDEALTWVVRSIIQNAGQTCSAGSRLIVERSIHDEFVTRVVEKMENLRIGPGIEDPDLGPIISEKQLERILSYIEFAREDGVRILTGGKIGGRFFSGRIFLQAHCIGWSHARSSARQGRDLRSRSVRPDLREAPRGGRHRQWYRVWSDNGRLDQRRQQGSLGRLQSEMRSGVRQQLRGRGRYRDAVRRLR